MHLDGTYAALELLFYNPDEDVRNYVMMISLQETQLSQIPHTSCDNQPIEEVTPAPSRVT